MHQLGLRVMRCALHHGGAHLYHPGDRTRILTMVVTAMRIITGKTVRMIILGTIHWMYTEGTTCTRAPEDLTRASEVPTRAPEAPTTRASEVPTRASEVPTRAPEVPSHTKLIYLTLITATIMVARMILHFSGLDTWRINCHHHPIYISTRPGSIHIHTFLCLAKDLQAVNGKAEANKTTPSMNHNQFLLMPLL